MTATDPIPSAPSSPARVTELLHVIDLEARWSNLIAVKTGLTPSLAVLGEKQRAYEAFRVRASAYQSRFATAYQSEPLLGNPVRLAAWCRAMRDVCLAASSSGQCPRPAHLLAKAYRVAEGAAAKFGSVYIRPSASGESVAQVAEELDALARWVEGLTLASSRLGRVVA